MPPAWRSALSPAGLGEDGGVLVTAGRLHAPRAAVWLLLSWASLHDVTPLVLLLLKLEHNIISIGIAYV
jgi:hypothetical protein